MFRYIYVYIYICIHYIYVYIYIHIALNTYKYMYDLLEIVLEHPIAREGITIHDKKISMIDWDNPADP